MSQNELAPGLLDSVRWKHQKVTGILHEAFECFQRSLALREQLLKESDTTQNRRELSISLNRIGAIYQAQNKLDMALECFQRSLALCEKLYAESRIPQTKNDLFFVLDQVVKLKRISGHTDIV